LPTTGDATDDGIAAAMVVLGTICLMGPTLARRTR
jgi:hypothetical protein